MTIIAPDKVISTILKHDSKVTSYKIALLRAINDVVLTYPDLRTYQSPVAVPLKLLAKFWVAYYWPFVDPAAPIQQGPQVKRDGKTRNDMAFTPALSKLRGLWEQAVGGLKNPADGFFLINELKSTRKWQNYPDSLVEALSQAVSTISRTLEMPIRYAGPGEWSVFSRPPSYSAVASSAVAVPGTDERDRCLVIPFQLWDTFRQMSLWIEALCIHEWCLLTERISNVNRGAIYSLLTARPDNRRPLTWERNQVDLLMMEGAEFTCPWTERRFKQGTPYDLDHILPIAVYPTNELWNLVPSDPSFNLHQKRERLPTSERLATALPHLERTYAKYGGSSTLDAVLREDAALRFASVQSDLPFAVELAFAVIDLVGEVAELRNLARF
ncbi:MAG: HNH endonuclease domain-containing protein [Phormidesmis sp.]